MRLGLEQQRDQGLALVLGGAPPFAERLQAPERNVVLEPHQIGTEASRGRGDAFGLQPLDQLLLGAAQAIHAQPDSRRSVVGEQQLTRRRHAEAR